MYASGALWLGQERVTIEGRMARLDVWIYMVGDSLLVSLVGPEATLSVMVVEGRTVAGLETTDGITARLEHPQGELLRNRWTKLSVRITNRNVLVLQIGAAITKRKLHFYTAGRLSATTMHLLGENVYISFDEPEPSFPPNTDAFPERKTRPLSSVADLDAFEPSSVSQRKNAKPNLGKCLLVCHDFKGGYLESDASMDTVFGCDQSSEYCFTFWGFCGVFCYFSHERISVPPTAWIKAARANCTPIIGTLITEWDPQENVELFERPVFFAKKLIALAAENDFDGWLINIEAPMRSVRLLQNLELFLLTLKQSDKICIFYDSITADTGAIEWQNTLTDRNRKWMLASDGLFTNYCWNPDMLPTSANSKVFVGVDTFGRGAYLGGQLASGAALKEASSRGLSGALFAPGWTTEACKLKTGSDDILWRGLPWSEQYVDMVVEHGSFENKDDGCVTASHMECCRHGSLKVTLGDTSSSSGVTLVRVTQELISGIRNPYFIQCNVNGEEAFVQEYLQVDSRSWSCEFVLQGATELLVSIRDGGSDAKGWAGHFGVTLGKIRVDIVSTLTPRTVSIADSYGQRMPEAPEQSSFCIGSGDAFHVDGDCVVKQNWANLGLQNRLPFLYWGLDAFSYLSRGQAWSFGSSLRVVTANLDTVVPIYDTKVERTFFRAIVRTSGNDDVFFSLGGHVLPIESSKSFKSGWKELTMHFKASRGILAVSTLSNVFIGLISFHPAPKQVRFRPRVQSSFFERGRQNNLLSWSKLNVENLDVFSSLDICNNGKWVARVIPSLSGSYADRNVDENCTDYEIILN